MTPRRRTLGAVLALLCLPVVVALVEAVTFQVRNRNNRSIVSAGERREYLVYVPESYDSGRPTPLVISLHGAGGWPAQQQEISGWSRLADEHGFIVAYPSAVGGRGTRAWRLTRSLGRAKDVRFVSDVIDDLEKTYNIDPSRIYASGLSAGGGMSFALSCTLGERIAAIGTVAAARVLPWSECADPRPVPVMAFHGTADSLIPYAGGTTWIADTTFPDVEAWMASWARRRPHLARRRAAAGVAPRPHAPQHRRDASDVDVLPGASKAVTRRVSEAVSPEVGSRHPHGRRAWIEPRTIAETLLGRAFLPPRRWRT